ncbi:MAG: hypothetical protein SGJ09_11770 [Phycisphaerae bacterium]|nr:hypothetical protein [Phycisphaerae bacterium]
MANSRTLHAAFVATCLPAIALIATVALPSVASAQLIAYDGFGNGPLADLNGSSGGFGWSTAWTDVTLDQPTSVTGVGLTYLGMVATPGGAVTGTTESVFPLSMYCRSFSPPRAGSTSIFVSFLLRPDASFGSWGGVRIGDASDGVYVGIPIGIFGFYGLMEGMGSGEAMVSFSGVPVVEGVTALLVVEIAPAPGGGHSCKLYVNPAVGAVVPATPAAMLNITDSRSLSNGLCIDNQGGFTTDEIRVGTTWQDVVPESPACVADLDFDGSVGPADLALLLGQWSLVGGDLDGDKTTGSSDIAILLGSWGQCP